MAGKVTLRERCFTPCPEHSPDWEMVGVADEHGTVCRDQPEVADFLRAHSHSPTTWACQECSRLTLAEARRYAAEQATRKIAGWKITDARWWWQQPQAYGLIVGRTYPATTTCRPVEEVWPERLEQWTAAASNWRTEETCQKQQV